MMTTRGGKVPFTEALVKAGVEIGYDATDHNGKQQEGDNHLFQNN